MAEHAKPPAKTPFAQNVDAILKLLGCVVLVAFLFALSKCNPAPQSYSYIPPASAPAAPGKSLADLAPHGPGTDAPAQPAEPPAAAAGFVYREMFAPPTDHVLVTEDDAQQGVWSERLYLEGKVPTVLNEADVYVRCHVQGNDWFLLLGSDSTCDFSQFSIDYIQVKSRTANSVTARVQLQ